MKHGMSGLELKEPKKPTMPNKVDSDTEARVLTYVTLFPNDGPKRIFYELKSEGISIGETGIYNVLKRNMLTTKEKRIAYAKEAHLSKHAINSIYKSNPSKRKKDKEKSPIVEMSTYPGHCVIQRIDYMGTFDGIGKIYQYSVIDTFSRWGIVKLYNSKKAIDVWDYFEVKLVYLMKIFNLNIKQLLTVKSKTFVPFFVSGDKYQEILDAFQIDHRFISEDISDARETSKMGNVTTYLDTTESIEALDTFNSLLVKGFYEKIGNDANYDNFAQVERAMNKFVRFTNFSNPIISGVNTGKKPAEVVLKHAVDNNVDLDTLPLWLMAVINAPKRATHEHIAHDWPATARDTHEEKPDE